MLFQLKCLVTWCGPYFFETGEIDKSRLSCLLKGESVNLQREQIEGIAGLLIEELELEGIIYKAN